MLVNDVLEIVREVNSNIWENLNNRKYLYADGNEHYLNIWTNGYDWIVNLDDTELMREDDMSYDSVETDDDFVEGSKEEIEAFRRILIIKFNQYKNDLNLLNLEEPSEH